MDHDDLTLFKYFPKIFIFHKIEVFEQGPIPTQL